MSNKSLEFKEMARSVRSQLARRPIDSSELHVVAMGGTVHITGIIRACAGQRELNLKSEMEIISDILRTKPGITDVVWDVTQRS